MSALYSLPDVRKQPIVSGCCSRAKPISDNDRVLYYPSTRSFQVTTKSCWTCCCSSAEVQRDAQTWQKVKELIVTTAGQRIAELALIQCQMTVDYLCDDSVLTVGKYEKLKNKVQEITALQPIAIMLCKVSRFYNVFLQTEVARSMPEPLSGRLEIVVAEDPSGEQQRIDVVGGDLGDTTEVFNREKIVTKLCALTCVRPIERGDAQAIAGRVAGDLEREHLTKIGRKDLTRRIVMQLKIYDYVMKKPFQWDALKSIAEKYIEQMNAKEYEVLIGAAQVFRAMKTNQSEGKVQAKPVRVRGLSNYHSAPKESRVGASEGQVILHQTVGPKKLPKHMKILGATFDQTEVSPPTLQPSNLFEVARAGFPKPASPT